MLTSFRQLIVLLFTILCSLCENEENRHSTTGRSTCTPSGTVIIKMNSRYYVGIKIEWSERGGYVKEVAVVVVGGGGGGEL
jgi:hypothetical protein